MSRYGASAWNSPTWTVVFAVWPTPSRRTKPPAAASRSSGLSTRGRAGALVARRAARRRRRRSRRPSRSGAASAPRPGRRRNASASAPVRPGVSGANVALSYVKVGITTSPLGPTASSSASISSSASRPTARSDEWTTTAVAARGDRSQPEQAARACRRGSRRGRPAPYGASVTRASSIAGSPNGASVEKNTRPPHPSGSAAASAVGHSTYDAVGVDVRRGRERRRAVVGEVGRAGLAEQEAAPRGSGRRARRPGAAARAAACPVRT